MEQIESEGHNVRIISAVSEELFNRQSQEYKDHVLPASAKYNMMVVSTGTKRMWPVAGVGPLTEEYSLVSDHDDMWLSGGSEGEVLKEAGLDPDTIFQAVAKFAREHSNRMKRQSELLAG